TVAVSLLFVLGWSLTQATGPLLTKLAIDRYLTGAAHPAPSILVRWLAADARTGLLQITAIYLLNILIGFVCDFSETYLMQRTGQYAMFDLRKEVMQHLQKLDVAYYDHNPVGRLVTRVTTDVDALNEMWTSGLLAVLADFFALCVVVVAMFRLSPGLTRSEER